MAIVEAQEIFARARQKLGVAFDPAAARLLPVSMRDDRFPFDEAWDWCTENCVGKWRYEGYPAVGGVLFEFEHDSDALVFALTFAESRAP